MKSWLSNLFLQTTEQGRSAARLAIIFMVAAFLAVLIFAYVAVQTGVWQAYAVIGTFIGFFAVQALVVNFARRNRVDIAGLLLIGAVCYIVLMMTMFMSGIGLGLSIALAVVIVEIVFETLSGPLARRAGLSGFVFAIAIFLMDKFAFWNRPSLPEVQYAIPTIAAGTVITIAFLMIGRLFTWQNLSMARKLLVAFSTLTLLALLVGVMANVGLRRVRNSFETALLEGDEMENVSLHIRGDLSEARQLEKDFLLHWQELGYETAYETYIIPHTEAVSEIRQHVEELPEFAPAVARELQEIYPVSQFEADLALMNQDLDEYEKDLQLMLQLIQERGFQNTGLEGEFRETAHHIEDRIINRDGLDVVVITMLQARRHEKDYLLRGDQEYIDAVHQSVAKLKKHITSSDPLSSKEKTEILALADQYLIAFDALVAKDVELAAVAAELKAVEETMVPLADNFAETGQKISELKSASAQTTASQTLLYTSGALVVAILFAVFLSITLSRQITRPVRDLTNAAHELEAGNYDAHAEITSGDEIGALANAFNRMALQIKQALATVAQRAAELQTVAEVSASTSTVLETDKLLWNISNLTKERFGLYHAHIYLMNDAGDTLVLAAGAGEAGQQMVAKSLSIPLDREQSLVARSAREQRGVIVNDVRSAPDFLPNPLLPETRSELAVPMILSDKVIGVFDIQSDQVNRFTQENADIQTTLAAQIAVAVQNARSYAEVQARAKRESLIASIGQKIQDTSTVESALQVAVRELGRAVGQETFVRLYTRQNGN